MNPNPPVKLTDLPDEVIQAVLSYVPAKSAISLQRTCRRLANLINTPILWKDFLQTDFTYFDSRHHLSTKLHDSSFIEWKELYAERHTRSYIARQALEEIINNEVGKLDRVQDLLDIGYDAKDVLIDAYMNAAGSPNHLAQKYWSHAALGSLHRWLALQELKQLRSNDEHNATLARALGALDMFILQPQDAGDFDGIIGRLDSYAISVRRANPLIDELSPREKATVIAEHLIQNRWTGIHDDRNYHSLDHLFIGVGLFSDNRNSVPLISAAIFCYVARKFDLRAQPCSFPFHVYAVVQPPVGVDLDGDPHVRDSDAETIDERVFLFMDPFRSSTPVSISQLDTMLKFIIPGSRSVQNTQYLRPASAEDLVIRAAHNIISAPSQYSGPPVYPVDPHLADYAALFVLVFFPQLFELDRFLRHLGLLTQRFLRYFELDLSLYETYVLPLTIALVDAGRYRDMVQSVRAADRRPPIPKSHSHPDNSSVKYRVGQVFRHRQRDYLAVIYGWDPECKMPEDWIAVNNVDRLPRGRSQPYYHVLVDDESTRYVAEENVNLLLPHDMGEDMSSNFPIEIGKYFKRFDLEKGEFISNVRAEYPED